MRFARSHCHSRWLSVALNLGDLRVEPCFAARATTPNPSPAHKGHETDPHRERRRAGGFRHRCRAVEGGERTQNGGQHIRRHRCGVGLGGDRQAGQRTDCSNIHREKGRPGEHAGCRRIEGKDGTVLRECQSGQIKAGAGRDAVGEIKLRGVGARRATERHREGDGRREFEACDVVDPFDMLSAADRIGSQPGVTATTCRDREAEA